MPLTKGDAMDAWRRGLMGSSAEEASVPEGPGLLMTGLDYLSRPVSGVMGGFFGALSEEVGVGEGIVQGLTGERYFSAYDFALEAGADPDSKATRYGSLAVDVLNPVDPLNYVGAGFTKAGKVARNLSKAGAGAESVGKITSRVQAAEKGLWNPLVFAGHGVAPKSVSVPIARAVDKAADRLTKSKFVTALAPYVGGVKKFEAQFPGLSSMMSGAKRQMDVDEDQFVRELVGIEDALRGQGLGEDAVQKTMEDVLGLLERPETRLARVERELELVDDALAGKQIAQVGPAVASGPAVLTPEQARVLQVEDDVIERYLGTSGGKTEQRVRLSDLRSKLGRYTREEQDAVLLRMQREGKLVLMPLDDPMDVTPADIDAALHLGARPEGYTASPGEHVGNMNTRDLVYLKPEALQAQEARLTGRGAQTGMSASPSQTGMSAPVEEVTAVNVNNQRAVDRRVGELRVQLQKYELSGAVPEGVSASALRDELHVLESVQVSRFQEDMPPLDVLAERRAGLSAEAEKIRTLWDEAGPETLEAYGRLKPLLDETKRLYEEVLRKYDPDFEFPVEDYVKHMFPLGYSKLPKNVKSAREAILAEKQAIAAELKAAGYDERAIERMVRERLGAKQAVLDASDNAGLLTGELDAFKSRQYNETVEEFNARAGERGLPEFETYSGAIASAMRRDANRWRYGHDVHQFILDKPGWTLGAEDYGKLSAVEQKGWVKMDFHVPWIDPAKNPFKDRYMRAEVAAIRDSQMRGMGKLLTDDGLNGVLGALNTFRKYWVAWTLAPFPSTRVRDLASDVVLNNLAGLNPAVDLAKAAFGESAYAASLALNARRSKMGAIRGAVGESPRNLSTLLGKVQGKFPELTEEKLIEYMEIEGVLGPSAVRDLDIAAALSNDPLMKKARAERGRARRMLSGFTLNPDRSPIIKTGFKVAEATADFTRGALFFDGLVRHLDEAQSLDDLLTASTARVRRHLFDYTDLTQVERDVLKNIIPFYTFTAKNLPLQISQAATDPGRSAWVNRLYQGAWGQFEEGEIRDEDLPEWLQSSMGMPISAYEAEDGSRGYSIWTPRGWLPQTELNEMADIVRGKAGSAILSRLSPVLKEPFEQLLNRDAFTMRDIEDGTVRDLFGVPVNRRVLHLVNNLRLVSEVDRLDPGGLWTKIGQQLGYWEGDERPHRWTAPEGDRWMRTLSGLNVKGVVPTEQAERQFRDADREANAAVSRTRYALRRGQTYEAEQFMTQVAAHRTAGQKAMARLNELRRRNALDVEKQESRR